MPHNALYVAAYDLCADAERDRVAQVLAGFGFRVQRSVFECRLTRSALTAVEERLHRLELRSGCVLIYRVESRAARRLIGEAPPAETVGFHRTFALVV